MPDKTTEELMQDVVDMRARILDPEQTNPTESEIFQAVQLLHRTRGAAAKVAKKNKPVIDLNSLFAPAAKPAADLNALFPEEKK